MGRSLSVSRVVYTLMLSKLQNAIIVVTFSRLALNMSQTLVFRLHALFYL